MAGRGQGRLVRGGDQAGGHGRGTQATWGQRCCLGPGSNLSNSAPFLGGTVRFRVHLPAGADRPAAIKAPCCRGPAPWGSPAPGSTCSRPHPLPHPAHIRWTGPLSGSSCIPAPCAPSPPAHGQAACGPRSVRAGVDVPSCFLNAHAGPRRTGSCNTLGETVPSVGSPAGSNCPVGSQVPGVPPPRMTSVLCSLFQVAGAAAQRSKTASLWWPWTSTGIWAVSSARLAGNN